MPPESGCPDGGDGCSWSDALRGHPAGAYQPTERLHAAELVKPFAQHRERLRLKARVISESVAVPVVIKCSYGVISQVPANPDCDEPAAINPGAAA